MAEQPTLVARVPDVSTSQPQPPSLNPTDSVAALCPHRHETDPEQLILRLYRELLAEYPTEVGPTPLRVLGSCREYAATTAGQSTPRPAAPGCSSPATPDTRSPSIPANRRNGRTSRPPTRSCTPSSATHSPNPGHTAGRGTMRPRRGRAHHARSQVHQPPCRRRSDPRRHRLVQAGIRRLVRRGRAQGGEPHHGTTSLPVHRSTRRNSGTGPPGRGPVPAQDHQMAPVPVMAAAARPRK